MSRSLLLVTLLSVLLCSQAAAEIYPVTDVAFLKNGFKVFDPKSPAEINQGAARTGSLATLMRARIPTGAVHIGKKAVLRLYVSLVEVYPKPTEGAQLDAANARLEFSRMLVDWKAPEGIAGLSAKAPEVGVHFAEKPFAAVTLSNRTKRRDIILVGGLEEAVRKWSSGEWPNYGFIVRLVNTGSPAVVGLNFGVLTHRIAAAIFTGADVERAGTPSRVLSVKINEEPLIETLQLVDGAGNGIPVTRSAEGRFTYGRDEPLLVERRDDKDEITIRLSLPSNKSAHAVQMVLGTRASMGVKTPVVSVYSERIFKNKRYANLLELDGDIAVRWAGVRGDGAAASCKYFIPEKEGETGILRADLRGKPGVVVVDILRGKKARLVLDAPASANVGEDLAEKDSSLSVLLHRRRKYVFTGDEAVVTPEIVRASPAKKLDAVWKVFDDEEREVSSGRFVIEPEMHGFTDPVSFQCVNNGVWRFSLAVRDGEKEILRREALIAVFPKHGFADGEDTPLGFCRHAWTRHDDEYLNRMAMDMGASWFRIWVRIFVDARLEGDDVKFKLNKRALDVFRRLHDDHKLKVLGVLGPLQFSKTWQKDLRAWCRELKQKDIERYKKLYERMLKILVTQLGPYVDYWETMNEPYYEHRDEVALYVELSRMTRSIVSKHDPDAKIVGTCGPPGNMGYEWFAKLFEAHDLENQDIVSHHPYTAGYGTSYLPARWSRAIKALISKFGGRHPLWNTEYGLHPDSFYRLPRYRFSIAPKTMRMDPKICAAVVVKQTLSGMAGGTEKSFIFTVTAGRAQSLDIVEYDGTPKHLCVAFAAMNKFLRGRKFTRELQRKEDSTLKVFAFEGAGAPLLVFTTVGYKPGESMTVTAPAGEWRYFDAYGNPLSAGAEDKISLAVDVVYAVAAKGTVLPAPGSIRIIEQRRHVEKIKEAELRDDTKPEDWHNRVAVDLRRCVNRSFTDTEAEDGQGGWTDEGVNDMRNLPVGKLKLAGVPFVVIDPKTNNGKSCLVMKSRGISYEAPEKQRIPVGLKARKLHFLHTSTYTADKVAADIVVHFRDGGEIKIPVRTKFEITDWCSKDKPALAEVAWRGSNPRFPSVSLFKFTFENPRPTDEIQYIEIVSRMGSSRYVLVAVTAELAF